MDTSSSDRRLMNGAAWNDFCDDLKGLGEQILRPETPADPQSRAEGYRHLTHVLRSALDIFVDHADPGLPNWLSTAGHRVGTWSFRWIGAKEHIDPQVRVLKAAALR